MRICQWDHDSGASTSGHRPRGGRPRFSGWMREATGRSLENREALGECEALKLLFPSVERAPPPGPRFGFHIITYK